jgi:hypothetical protein
MQISTENIPVRNSETRTAGLYRAPNVKVSVSTSNINHAGTYA